MNEWSPEPPATRYNPELADHVYQTGPDGSRWRWTGDRWVRVDPPGTDRAAIRFHQAVMPLVDLAVQLHDSATQPEEAIARLWEHPGCDQEAFHEAAGLYPADVTWRARAIRDLLTRAANSRILG